MAPSIHAAQLIGDGADDVERRVVAADVHRRQTITREDEPRDLAGQVVGPVRSVLGRDAGDAQRAPVRPGDLDVRPAGQRRGASAEPRGPGDGREDPFEFNCNRIDGGHMKRCVGGVAPAGYARPARR